MRRAVSVPLLQSCSSGSSLHTHPVAFFTRSVPWFRIGNDREDLFAFQQFLLEQCVSQALQGIAVFGEHRAGLLMGLLHESFHLCIYPLSCCLRIQAAVLPQGWLIEEGIFVF